MKFTLKVMHLLLLLFCSAVVQAQDASVTNIYSIGKIPLNYGGSHQVKARIQNTSAIPLTNLPVTLTVTGANSFTDVQTIASLPANAVVTVTFAGYSNTTLGNNVLTVTIPPDVNNANNSRVWNQVVTTNLYGYKEPTLPNAANGVGFTGGTGSFVAKFNTATPANVNEVKVDFTVAGQPYSIGIWDATGPG
ncbi:MAG: hypothetical protein EOO04_35665, partial [Chitinophagaceae bacterium]